jgi:hypothetical protein
VSQTIIPLSQFDIHVSLAEATRGKNNKKLPIKAIVTTLLFEEKQQPIYIEILSILKYIGNGNIVSWWGLGRGESHVT